MSNRIKSIRLNNFKFYRDTDNVFDLGEGSNLLLYGENGSGKSSIYWALYTLFESSLKNDVDEIRKYFSKSVRPKDCLVNIHAQENPAGSDNFDSYIEVKTTDIPEKKYTISNSETSININIDAKITNYASDFINYRLLQSISNFSHSDEIDLHTMFVDGIFKYLQFSKVKITRDDDLKELTNAYDIWKEIKQGHNWIDSENSRTPRRILTYKYSDHWHEFKDLVDSFNESLQSKIDYINIQAPKHFEALGYDFTFSLELEKKADYEKKETNYKYLPFVIRLHIPEYEKLPNVIHKPHSFLNEAKLSAIAISIRLAILTEKKQEECLKFILLDDLLISLDMKNRESVLDLLLSDAFVNDYQLFILTHDKMFFQMAKYKINILEQNNWKYVELGENVDSSGLSKPKIKISKSYYEKAYDFYKRDELPEAANNLRKAAEEFCKKILSKKQTISEDYSSFDLNGMIEHCVLFAISNDLKVSYFNHLDKFRKFILNSASHDDYDTPIFRSEIDNCLEIFKNYFNKVKIRHELHEGEKFHFEMTDRKGKDIYKFEFILREDLRSYQEPDSVKKLIKVKVFYTLFKNGNQTAEENDFVSLNNFYNKVFSTSDKKGETDFLIGIKSTTTNKSLKEILGW